MSDASEYQPLPKDGNQIVIEQVKSDLVERAEFGMLKYGTYLQTFNGTDPLWDAYQEALDLSMYLRQAIMERDTKEGENAVH